ncbi:MAG: hypothetical protein LCH83_13780 [Proteobacteria bacterium]|nr:hypothetical protein [Pseudomonadota bacterium]
MDYLRDLSETKRDKYRALVENINTCPSKKDEMISLVRSMMQAFVNAAFGEDSVQIVLDKRLKDSFQNATINVKTSDIETVEQCREISIVPDDPEIGGDEKIKIPIQENEP